jgi:DNA-binding NarL/FixJ family response regulator
MECSVTDIYPNRQVRIVIVDDDPASRKMMVWALQADQDFVVAAEFAEGAAAVAAIRNPLPDVVLIDLGLPRYLRDRSDRENEADLTGM